MISKLFYSLLAASVVTAGALAAGYGVTRLPQGKTRDVAERCVAAPGQALYARFAKSRIPERLPKDWREKLPGPLRLMEPRDVGAWACAALIICLILTFILGVSSTFSALILGVKVTVILFLLRAALVLGRMLFPQKLGG